MNATGKSWFGSEERVIFTIVGVLVVALFGALLMKPDAVAPDVAEISVSEQDIEPAPKVAVTPEVVVDKPAVQAPTFDVVRVDAGAAMIAGKAAPNTDVRLMADDTELGVVRADDSGAFAMFADVPTGDAPVNLSLETMGEDAVQSAQQVLIVPPKEEATTPQVVIAQADGTVDIQQPTQSAPRIQALSLDMINYSNRGDVIFAGRGAADQSVRVYVDNKPVSLGAVDNGTWEFEVPDIKEGIYTVRVDAVDDSGQVVERVESPFQRVIAQMDAGAVTIQPGFTLWQLAEIKYGAGDRFVQIFDANRDLIKDPNMIFPGQIFAVPEE